MTNQTLAVYEHILTQYGTALSAACSATVVTTKGYPVWGRPALQLPCVALEVYAWQPSYKGTGRALGQGALGLRGWVFARHEPELCTLLDTLLAWHKISGGAFESAAQRIATELLEIKRYEPELAIQEEAHALTFLVQAVY